MTMSVSYAIMMAFHFYKPSPADEIKKLKKQVTMPETKLPALLGNLMNFLFIVLLKQFYRSPFTQFIIFYPEEEFCNIASFAHLFKFGVSVLIGLDVGVINEQPGYPVGGFVWVFVELVIVDCDFPAGCYFPYVFCRAEDPLFPYAVQFLRRYERG